MPKKNRVLIFFIYFFLFVFTVVIFFSFFFEVKIVKGDSMLPALKSGQVIIVGKLAYGLKALNKNRYLIRWAKPKLNDIVVYKINGHLSIKRIAGTYETPVDFFSGFNYNEYDTIYKMQIENKTIELNAIQFRKLGGFAQKEKQGIPPDTVLALGDNLDKSYDSRDYGFVSIDSIYGKVLLWK